jgi:integrase
MRAYVPGTRKYVREPLKTTDVHEAITLARRRYMRIVVKIEEGLPVFETAISKMLDQWIKDCEALAEAGEHSKSVLRVQRGAVNRYLKTYFGTRPITSIKHKEGEDYWLWRIDNAKSGKAHSKITLERDE